LGISETFFPGFLLGFIRDHEPPREPGYNWDDVNIHPKMDGIVYAWAKNHI
jgi:hypothetical protein